MRRSGGPRGRRSCRPPWPPSRTSSQPAASSAARMMTLTASSAMKLAERRDLVLDLVLGVVELQVEAELRGLFLEGRRVRGAPAALGAGLDEPDRQVLHGLRGRRRRGCRARRGAAGSGHHGQDHQRTGDRDELAGTCHRLTSEGWVHRLGRRDEGPGTCLRREEWAAVVGAHRPTTPGSGRGWRHRHLLQRHRTGPMHTAGWADGEWRARVAARTRAGGWAGRVMPSRSDMRLVVPRGELACGPSALLLPFPLAITVPVTGTVTSPPRGRQGRSTAPCLPFEGP